MWFKGYFERHKHLYSVSVIKLIIIKFTTNVFIHLWMAKWQTTNALQCLSLTGEKLHRCRRPAQSWKFFVQLGLGLGPSTNDFFRYRLSLNRIRPDSLFGLSHFAVSIWLSQIYFITLKIFIGEIFQLCDQSGHLQWVVEGELISNRTVESLTRNSSFSSWYNHSQQHHNDQ